MKKKVLSVIQVLVAMGSLLIAVDKVLTIFIKGSND